MFTCIFKNMMLMFDEFGRNIFNSIVGIRRKDIISAREIFIQFFFGNGMLINNGFQVLHIRLAFTFTFGTFTYRFQR